MSGWAWVFCLMIQAIAWIGPRRYPARYQADATRLHELVAVAVAAADASDDPEDQAALVAIGWYESGYTIRARGKLGEIGVWQLMPPAPVGLVEQAREALRRLHQQHWCGYTGEACRCPCPLAEHRRALAARLLAEASP